MPNLMATTELTSLMSIRPLTTRAWKELDLPHDFAIEGPFIAPGQPGSDGATGRLPYFGVAWYRKHLSIPADDAGKRFYLDVDGAMSYATVWCNGQIVGGWPYGYASWRVDLTPMIKPGADNVLAIRLDNPPNSSRWYPGGGIYRNVWLTKTAPIHVSHWGTYITTPEVSTSSATVSIQTGTENDSKSDAAIILTTAIYPLDDSGAELNRSNPPLASSESNGLDQSRRKGHHIADAASAQSEVVESEDTRPVCRAHHSDSGREGGGQLRNAFRHSHDQV